mmetsp:Transcript_7031/g.21409  ORF Transcript_7031/g.21409 Transcript_7031/m.21409 type:complete len:492 (+) Transcript_7031:51-1526(+)
MDEQTGLVSTVTLHHRHRAVRGLRWSMPVCFVIIIVLSAAMQSLFHTGLRPFAAFVRASDETGGFFWISDLHLEPIYDPHEPANEQGVCRKRESGCPKAELKTESDVFPYGRVGCDPPMKLVDAMLHEMRTIDPQPPFILFTGDAIGHNLPCEKLQQTTFRKVSKRIEQYFPHVPVIAVVGNIDLFPANHLEIGPDPQLRRIFDAYESVGWFENAPDAIMTFPKGGYYSIRPLKGLRIIVYNSLYYLSKLTKWNPSTAGFEKVPCSRSVRGKDPQKQFEWLKNELQQAKEHGEKVYLTSHISPGAKERSSNWCDTFLETFVDILDTYKKEVVVHFYGDHNRQEIRLIRNEKEEAISVGYINPGLTPRRPTLQGSNPMFRQVIYRKSSFELIDFIDRVFPLQEMNYEAHRFGTELEKWSRIPSYTRDFEMKDLSPVEAAKFVDKLSKDFDLLQKYILRQNALWLGNRDAAEYICDARCMKVHESRKCERGEG